MTTSLRTLLPLAVLLAGLSLYGFISAQATPAPADPPNGNTSAPLNTGSSYQVKAGDLGAISLRSGGYCSADGTNCGLSVLTASDLADVMIQSANPTLEFSDSSTTLSAVTTFWLHNNDNQFYLLADRNDNGTWSGEGPFPFRVFAGATSSDDWALFSNQVRSPEYCDQSGGNCFTSSEVATLNTSGFINTSATAQTKVGNLELENDTPQLRLTDTNGRDTFLRTNDDQFYILADRNSDNSFDAAPHPLQMTIGATAAGDIAYFSQQLRAPIVIGNTEVRSDRYCNEAGGNCVAQGSIVVAGDNYLAPVVEGTARLETGNLCTTTGTNCSTPTDINRTVNALVGTAKIQKGEAALPRPGEGTPPTPTQGSLVVAFPDPFVGVPTVTFTPRWGRYTGDEGVTWWVTGITRNGFTINWHGPGGGTNVGGNGVQWIAID
jgi:hypothetical protein